MSKLNVKAFRDLVDLSRVKANYFANVAKDNISRAKNAKAWVLLTESHNGDKPVPDITSVKDKDGNYVEELSLDKEEKSEKNISVVLNWLVKLVTDLWLKVSNQRDLITYNLENAEAKEAQLTILQKEVKDLQLYCDEIQQRSMKGNIIISSPNLGNGNKASLMKQLTVDGGARLETVTEMCQRLIHMKTGVEVPHADITACHVLGRHGADSTYILRIHNRKPDSAWDILAAGMLNGKNKQSGNYFANDVNVFINFQLTPARAKLLEEVKKERKSKRINSYGVDQNGRVTVRVGRKEETGWAQVKSSADLQHCIASPPTPVRRHQR